MNIEFSDKEKQFVLKEKTIRKVRDLYGEDDKILEIPHFQAIVESDKQSKGNIRCLLRYVDKSGHFLGFDQYTHWSETDKKVHSISMPITIPEGAAHAVFEISVEKSRWYEEYIGIAIIVLIVLFVFMGIGSLFD